MLSSPSLSRRNLRPILKKKKSCAKTPVNKLGQRDGPFEIMTHTRAHTRKKEGDGELKEGVIVRNSSAPIERSEAQNRAVAAAAAGEAAMGG